MKEIFVLVMSFLTSLFSGQAINNLKQNIPATPTVIVNSVSPTNLKINPTKKDSTVPLPTEEDIIRVFFTLINERRIDDALTMLLPKIAPDVKTKEAWGKQFEAMKTVNIKDISRSSVESHETDHIYKVNLNVSVNPDSTDSPIPYYGWENGENTRWITLVKDEKGIWKVAGIATGP
jgi:hypothetical protein